MNTYVYDNQKKSYPLARYFQSKDLKDKYNFKKIKVIGITGSYGKSSISLYIYHFLKEYLDICYIGTHKIIYKDLEIDTNNTTLEIAKLIELFIKYNIKCKYIVMEVSSHGINQARINLFKFKYLIFTNLGNDHLDYHLDKENYFNVKKSIFISTNAYKLCNENYYGRILKNLTYAKFPKKINDFNEFPSFMKENLLLCYSLLRKMHYKKKIIINKLKEIQLNNGRYEVIISSPYKIVIDYAHLPESYEAILNNNERKIVVFGCGGNRSIEKRSKIGYIVEKYAYYAIITSDNSRNEDFNEIAKQISKYMINYEIIKNRKEAINKALSLIKDNESLYIMGKGDEQYMEENNTLIPFNDKDYILNELHLRNNKK